MNKWSALEITCRYLDLMEHGHRDCDRWIQNSPQIRSK